MGTKKKISFRVGSGFIAVFLTEKDVEDFIPKPVTPIPAPGPEKNKVWAGETIEKEKAKQALKEKTYEVVCVSKTASAGNEEAPVIGEFVGLKEGVRVEIIDVKGSSYGVIPIHAVLVIFEEKP